MVVPEGLEYLGRLPFESFPAAMEEGGGLIAEGNFLGLQLIENAQLAFVEGMVASVYVAAVIAFIAAILVKRFMPSRAIYD